jgi:hypothetical protein
VSHEEAHGYTHEYDEYTDLASQHRCESGKTLLEGECQRPGEVLYGMRLLCVPHARLLKLTDHADALLDRVFRADEWLETAENLANQEGAEHVRREREEAIVQLRDTRIELMAASKGLD